MNVKLILFFRNGVQGWSETIYLSTADLNAAFSTALIYASKRSLLLALPANIDAIRVSDAEASRASRLVGVGSGTPFPMPASGYTSQSDQTDVAAQIGIFDQANAVQRAMMLRGLPDNVYDQAAPGNPDQSLFFTRLAAFLQEIAPLGGGPYRIAERIRLGQGGTERFIENVVVDWTHNETNFTLDTPLIDVPNGHLLNVYNMRGFQPTPGTVKLKRTESAGLNAIVLWVPNKPTIYQGGAQIVVTVETFKPITSASFIRIANRKTGRPFGVPRGRRRAIAR